MHTALNSAFALGYGAIRTLRNCAFALGLCAGAVWAGPQTLVALGDSLTQGYGLPPEDGFVPQLQAWLTGHGADVEVVNAGVSGDTTAGGAARLDWTLTPDVDAMIVTLGGNDMLRGIDPATSRANLTAIMEGAKSHDIPVLLIGMQAPGNYGPDYKAQFDAIYPDLAREYGAMLADSFFAPLMQGNADPAALGQYMQPDGIHPNKQGVARIVEGLGPQVLELLAKAPGAS